MLDCIEKKEFTSFSSQTLCDTHDDFDADITISGLKYASNLGLTLWPWSQTDFAGIDIEISGTLIINTQVCFYHSRVKFVDGGQIIVWYNGHIQSIYSDFFACNTMWPGITFLPALASPSITTGEFYYSQIEDAQYALVPYSTTQLVLLENVFNRNYVAIKNSDLYSPPAPQLNVLVFAENTFDCTSALNDPFTGQSPDPEGIPFCGILLNQTNATLNTYQTTNTFKHLTYGIHASESFFRLSNSEFHEMISIDGSGGIGIFADNSLFYVDQCLFNENMAGIHMDNTSAQIIGSRFIDNVIGVNSIGNLTSQTIVINRNLFSGNSLSSVRLTRSAAITNSHNRIDRNVIEGESRVGNTGDIFVSSFSPATDFISISDNFISYTDIVEPRGIHIRSHLSDNFLVRDDTILISGDSYTTGGGGIELSAFNSFGSVISGCFVQGDGPNSEQVLGIAGLGIGVYNSQNVTVCENIVDNMTENIVFAGNCDHSDIGLNDIGPATVGLIIRNIMSGSTILSNGVVGPQIRKANQWSTEQNAYGSFAARNMAPSNAWLMSQFRIHSNLNEFNPSPINPNSGWFFQDFGDPVFCSDVAVIISISSYDSCIVSNCTNLPPSGIWHERMSLMYKLLKYPDLQEYAENFFESGLDSTFGLFALVDTMIVSSMLFYQQDELLLEEIDSLIGLRYIEINTIDSLQEDILINEGIGNFNDSLAQLKSLELDSIMVLMTEQLDIRKQIRSTQIAALEDVLTFNNAIQTADTWEYSQKIVNKYRILFLMGIPFSENGLDSLRAIASDCIESAGFSVFLASDLLPICEQADYSYPESNECLQRQSSTAKRLQSNINETFVSPVLNVFPSPASDHIYFNSNVALSGTFEIYSMNGRLLDQYNVFDSNVLRMSVENLPNGTYLWRFIPHSGTSHYGRFIVVN